jgi:hypothetical protein
MRLFAARFKSISFCTIKTSLRLLVPSLMVKLTACSP